MNTGIKNALRSAAQFVILTAVLGLVACDGGQPESQPTPTTRTDSHLYPYPYPHSHSDTYAKSDAHSTNSDTHAKSDAYSTNSDSNVLSRRPNLPRTRRRY